MSSVAYRARREGHVPMRYIVNKQGTQVWHEIAQDALCEWTKEAGKEREKLTREFVKTARHGDIYLYGVYSIIAIELPEVKDDPREQDTTSS